MAAIRDQSGSVAKGEAFRKRFFCKNNTKQHAGEDVCVLKACCARKQKLTELQDTYEFIKNVSEAYMGILM